jgi:hypothetical protein
MKTDYLMLLGEGIALVRIMRNTLSGQMQCRNVLAGGACTVVNSREQLRPWQWWCRGRCGRKMFMTSNRRNPLENAVRWNAVASCAYGLIMLYSVVFRRVRKIAKRLLASCLSVCTDQFSRVDSRVKWYINSQRFRDQLHLCHQGSEMMELVSETLECVNRLTWLSAENTFEFCRRENFKTYTAYSKIYCDLFHWYIS